MLHKSTLRHRTYGTYNGRMWHPSTPLPPGQALGWTFSSKTAPRRSTVTVFVTFALAAACASAATRGIVSPSCSFFSTSPNLTIWSPSNRPPAWAGLPSTRSSMTAKASVVDGVPLPGASFPAAVRVDVLGAEVLVSLLVSLIVTPDTPAIAPASFVASASAIASSLVMEAWSLRSTAYRPRSARTEYRSTPAIGNPSLSTRLPFKPGEPGRVSLVEICAISRSICSRAE
mmetsp:Transcript_3529/g.13041  ORF Transcript_3529/g.13041 Transcript_3529/m.13041 type:complete len:230 (+) Transcript_3529:859-1548(+)